MTQHSFEDKLSANIYCKWSFLAFGLALAASKTMMSVFMEKYAQTICNCHLTCGVLCLPSRLYRVRSHQFSPNCIINGTVLTTNLHTWLSKMFGQDLETKYKQAWVKHCSCCLFKSLYSEKSICLPSCLYMFTVKRFLSRILIFGLFRDVLFSEFNILTFGHTKKKYFSEVISWSPLITN